jgi:glutamyl-tRNA synthetase
VRFAPSPTGFLHVGGGRTALFNWLLARRHGGVFVLRIEDTDLERSNEASVRTILDGLEWLGLGWDEGPFFQARRVEQHRAAALRLAAEGKAYFCFCAPEVLDARRRAAETGGGAWKYDRTCLAIDPAEAERRRAGGEAAALRFRVPDGTTAWDDLVHGATSFENGVIEDLVLLRSDGSPTYNLSVVVDDVDMTITHVIRGDDHISNTPKQILIYQALGQAPPRFAHLPLILGADKKRLSKRHGAVSVTEYRDRGILPDAMVNFLALLGWSPGEGREVMSRAEMIEAFSVGAINRKAVFDSRPSWLNAQYINALAPEAIDTLVRGDFSGPGCGRGDRPGGARRARFLRCWHPSRRARHLGDFARRAPVSLRRVGAPARRPRACRRGAWRRPPPPTAQLGAALGACRRSTK